MTTHTELAARLREAHDLSLDGNHFDARIAVLNVAAALESTERLAGAKQRNRLMTLTAPRAIWLNIFTDDPDGEFPADCEGITWSEDEVGDSDVPYIRADLATTPPPQAERVPLSDGDFAFLDDDGRQMMSTSHHYTVKDIKALIDDLKAVEQGAEQPDWINRDHRTRCGVIWRVMAALASDVPVAPLPEAERQDSARLDAMQQHRISVIPEYEGPWDAKVYGDEGEPEAVGTGSTPREAIDNAIAAHGITPKEGK